MHTVWGCDKGLQPVTPANWLVMLDFPYAVAEIAVTVTNYNNSPTKEQNRPLSKMTAKNSNKSKLKMYTSTRKNTFTLVTLQSFSILGVISAEKCRLKIEKFTDINVCKFFSIFNLIFSADIQGCQ